MNPLYSERLLVKKHNLFKEIKEELKKLYPNSKKIQKDFLSSIVPFREVDIENFYLGHVQDFEFEELQHILTRCQEPALISYTSLRFVELQMEYFLDLIGDINPYREFGCEMYYFEYDGIPMKVMSKKKDIIGYLYYHFLHSFLTVLICSNCVRKNTFEMYKEIIIID